LYYLPPYSPELNRIEILWKHAILLASLCQHKRPRFA
jgi:transposase